MDTSLNIATIDPNFQIQSNIQEEALVWYDVRKAPFRVYGLHDYQNQFVFRRVPAAVAKATGEPLERLSLHTAGGRVRFKTNSPYIALKTVQNGRGAMPHMPLTGSSSFDLYEKKEGQYTYQKTFIAPVHMTDGYENIFYCNRTDLRDYTLNFPLYHGVNALYIGLHKESVLDAGDRYIHEKPIVYYGSSITQGGCASRPGNAYQAHITRWFDTDHINLGFSGNGKGEKSMADWMASLDMGVFVSDYDFNAPTAEHLEATHKPLYETIRTAHPDIPYIILSRPNLTKKTIQTDARHAIIQKTYVDARAAGDKNVYFIPGNELFGEVDRDVCTVDTTHPTDEGFYRMAQRMARVIKHLDW